jgi:dTDP-4-amino-4,6-dideoxygalactose transaminase
MSLPSLSIIPEQQNSRSPEWRVPLAELSVTEDEIQDVVRVLRSRWWTSGPETEALEKEFAGYLGCRHAIAVSNGTAALQLAFMALRLSPEEEVVLPSLNFVAAANSILHTGSIPQFADVSSINSPVVSAESIEKILTKKTRGLCVMHYGGYPCSMDAIMDLARQHGLWVVEDAAHAPGASWKGIPCGRWGDIGCFSFFGNKNLTCAEGGILTTESDDLAKKLRLLRSHGMTSLTWDRFRGHSFSYDVTIPGFNFRMDDIRASLLRAQLRSLDRFNRLRKERVGWYREMLGQDPRWEIAFENYSEISAYHLLTVVVGEGIPRQEVMRFLKSRGIQTSIHYPPIHQFSYYRELPYSRGILKNTEDLGRRILTLPLYPDMTLEQVEFVCGSFREAIDREARNSYAG